MTDKTKNRLVRLNYEHERFPAFEWNEFLKNCQVNFYTNRHDAFCYSIRGKGFIIWITPVHGRRSENGSMLWYCDLEINKQAPKEGRQALQELIDGALAKFETMRMEYINDESV